MADTVKLTGLDDVINRLKALPPEIVSKRGGPALKALRAGANIIARQARINVRAAASGEPWDTGVLAKSIGVSRRPMPSGAKGEYVIVRVRRKKYLREGKTVTTHRTSAALEFGTEHSPAEPWMRPALVSTGAAAIKKINDVLLAQIAKIEAKKT